LNIQFLEKERNSLRDVFPVKQVGMCDLMRGEVMEGNKLVFSMTEFIHLRGAKLAKNGKMIV